MTAILNFILTKLWPVLLPLLAYGLWVWYRRHIHKEIIPVFGRGFVVALAASALIALILAMWSVVTVVRLDETYLPATMENGHLRPSEVRKR